MKLARVYAKAIGSCQWKVEGPSEGPEGKSVIKAGLGELAEFGLGKAHLMSGLVFRSEVGVEHRRVIGGKNDRDTMTE